MNVVGVGADPEPAKFEDCRQAMMSFFFSYYKHLSIL
jgi:hypothetical protein